MKKGILICFALIAFGQTFAEDFGSAIVAQVLEIKEDGGIVCDLKDLPDIIGKAITVYLADVDFSAQQPIQEKVKQYLTQTLIRPDNGEKPAIELHRIQRGKTFSLIAQISVNGADLTQQMVEQGLAQKTIQLQRQMPQETPPSQQAQPADNGKNSANPSAASNKIEYVGSKTSKVFHRADCPHAKRLDPAKTLVFQTRQQAEQNGRRPCKTCNP